MHRGTYTCIYAHVLLTLSARTPIHIYIYRLMHEKKMVQEHITLCHIPACVVLIYVTKMRQSPRSLRNLEPRRPEAVAS